MDFVNLGYSLPLWDRPLSLDKPCASVDWEEGRRLAGSLGVRNNELHFWEQREPEVENSQATWSFQNRKNRSRTGRKSNPWPLNWNRCSTRKRTYSPK